MGEEQSLGDFVEAHMGTAALAPVEDSAVPFYMFRHLNQLAGPGVANWRDVEEKLDQCAAETVEWLRAEDRSTHAWTLGVGSGGSGAPFHAHQSALNFQVLGRKLWHLYPPAHGNYTSRPQALWHNLHDAEAIEQPAFTFFQRTGELLYVPAYWPHATMALGDTISFSRVMQASTVSFEVENKGKGGKKGFKMGPPGGPGSGPAAAAHWEI